MRAEAGRRRRVRLGKLLAAAALMLGGTGSMIRLAAIRIAERRQAAPPANTATAAAANEFQKKLERIQDNAGSPGQHAPVRLTAVGANAWFALQGAKKLPRGVSHLLLSSQPGWVTGSALVDFDQLRRGHNASGALAEVLFTGRHRIFVRARVLSSAAPAASLRLETFSLDGRIIPNGLLDWALAEFVQPRNPKIRRQFPVSLPQGVRRAAVGDNEVTLYY